jgi:hypothetical protein
MKMEQQIVREMVTAITPELWVLFIQMLITVLFTLVLYQLLKNIAAYISLRFDKEFGKNVKVMYEGKAAWVVDVTIRRLTLKIENGNEILIPITKINQINWELIRNGGGGKT